MPLAATGPAASSIRTMPAATPLDLAGMILEIHRLLDDRADCPSPDELQRACDTLYAASLLKEEGRPVRARVVLAPPDAFSLSEGPPDGVHAIRFAAAHHFSPHDIKRLSPAASFFHSALAVWPDRDRGLRIWGILNTGPRWMNSVAGGRKPIGTALPHPVVHVRDPGWLIFYHDHRLVGEWRGREFHGPRLDVFQSRLLNERFAHLRLGLVQELGERCLPQTLPESGYADLCHLVSLQFIKRVINLVRTSGHGGSVVFLPDGGGESDAFRWIDCKYSVAPDEAGWRFPQLLKRIIRRVGQLCPDGSTLEDAWQVFRTSEDAELDRLEEAFFELARFFADLMLVDGAMVVDQRIRVLGFGGEIQVPHNVLQVAQAHDLDAASRSDWNVQSDGTRHRAVYRLCSVEPGVIGFVISQDSQVRMIANVDDAVTFWVHSVV
jgi:hypothetical protein